jgi:hypothetical protein
MHKIHKVIFTLTVPLHVSMDMPSSSGDTKCYRRQSIKKCKYVPVYNKPVVVVERFVT